MLIIRPECHTLPPYGPFLHSNEQWCRVEVRVDKNALEMCENVHLCNPACSGSIVRTHQSGMQERTIIFILIFL